jgi:hypothetical protein
VGSTACRPATLYESNDTVSEVLVDAGDAFDSDHQAGFLQDLASNAVLERFVEFKHAAGGFPVAVIVSLDDQHATVSADHDASDADRVSVWLP